MRRLSGRHACLADFHLPLTASNLGAAAHPPHHSVQACALMRHTSGDTLMNDRLARPETAASLRIEQLFDAQQQAFAANPYPSLDERRKNLRALKQQLHRYQDLLAEAI